MIVELALMGKNSVDVKDAVISGDLPPGFENKKGLRKYYPVIIIDFLFRGIPSKAGQHYVIGGKADVSFKAYVFNDEELELFKKKLSESDFEDSLKLVEGMTEESLGQLKVDIDEFLGPEKKEEKSSGDEDLNPFTALFSIFKSMKTSKKDKEKKKEIKDKKEIKSDNYAEKYIRNLAEANAINSCFTIYDVYKKGHGMAGFPYSSEASAKAPKSKAEELFKF
jgi:hypothetical protein